jgi:hypothetical protein
MKELCSSVIALSAGFFFGLPRRHQRDRGQAKHKL